MTLRITGAAAGDLSVEGPDDDLDASGCLVTPGLVNAHHHLLQTAFRTLPGTRGVPMATWLPTMAAAYDRVGVDAELTYATARAGLAESLLCGVTTVADHHLTWPGRVDSRGDGAAGAGEPRGRRPSSAPAWCFVQGAARRRPRERSALFRL
ncbi:triazine hydrolase, partial [Nocardioidaceae bacterium Broad-1]